MSRGRRFNDEGKLNYKKVAAVVIALIVIIMFIIIVKNLISDAKETKNIVPTSYYALYANNKWGIVDSNGNTVIEPMYQEMITVLNKSQDVFLCIYDVNEESGEYKTKVINSENKEIFTEYDKVETLENYDSSGNAWNEENILKVEKNGKYGVVDINKKEILKLEYDNIETLKGVKNSLVVEKDSKFGLVNNSGTIIANTEYSKIENIDDDYKHGYIVTDSDGNKGIISYTGTKILENKYENILKSYNENYFAIEENKKQKLINASGDTILDSGFDTIEQVNSDGIVFIKNKKYGFMDISGDVKIDAIYDELKEINVGVLRAKKDGKYGIINTEGEEKLAFTYNDIYYQAKAGLYVAENESYTASIIDSDFNVKLTGLISEFNVDSGYMKLRIGDQYKYYNFKFEEKDVKEILSSNTLFVSKQNGKYGFVDKSGNVVVDYIYDEALEQNALGFAAVNQNGLWGSIDSTGKVVVEPKYNLQNNLLIDFIGKWHLGQDLNMNYYCEK